MASLENLKALNFFQKEKEIEPVNKAAEFKPFSMSDKERMDILERNIASIELQISELKEYISNIFDGHVLINGQFRKITP
jgi:hypothetical protein